MESLNGDRHQSLIGSGDRVSGADRMGVEVHLHLYLAINN